MGSIKASLTENKLIFNETKSEEIQEDCLINTCLLEQNGVTSKLREVAADRKRGKEEDNLDGPWSFVVGMASFLAQVMLGGYVYTGGIYYTVFIEEYVEMGTMAVSWLCNLPVTLWFMGSPIGSMLTDRFGARVCSYTGGCLASLGLAISYLTNNFFVLFLGYGIIAGFGHGIMYIGFITSVTRYFKKYRAMVTILTTLGPMVGMSLYSFLIPFLIRKIHWRGSFLILGGIALNICVCASVLFPIKSQVAFEKTPFLDVLRNRNFVLFCLNSIATSLSSSLAFLHLPSLVLSYGLSPETASLTLTVFAISNSVAKVICSIVGQFVRADPVSVYNGFLFAYGISSALLPCMDTVTWIMCVVVVLSFSFNVCGGHTMEVILDLTGPEKFTSAVGFTQLCKAIGMLTAGPLAGILYEASGRYTTSFYVSGGLMTFGCTILIPAMVLRCRGDSSMADLNNRRRSVYVPEGDEAKQCLPKKMSSGQI